MSGNTLGRPAMLVVDESGKRLYWTDQGKVQIGHSDFNGNDRRVIRARRGLYDIAIFKVSGIKACSQAKYYLNHFTFIFHAN